MTATVDLGGLRTTLVGSPDTADFMVVLLHGYAMTPADLVPFAGSLRLPALFAFPEGPVQAEPAGKAWWAIDAKRRASMLRHGPRDLSDEYAQGRAAARLSLHAMLTALHELVGDMPLVLGGFSQGAMLACDHVIMDGAAVDGLIALSASRIAADDWAPCLHRVQGLPVFISHGRSDKDLAFSAGEGLRERLVDSGAAVTWVPFEGGHEVPLVVWRELRKFLRRRTEASHATG